MSTRKIKLTLEYNGTPFHGWQKQEGLPTVQEHLEEALKTMTGETIETVVAGRTDAGVHAEGQVCHFETTSTMPPYKFRDGLTRHLLPHIAVLDAEEVDENFHARFSATMRHYRFTIFNRRLASVHHQNRTTHIRPPLNIEAMRAALPPLLGEVDYSSFRSSECQSSTPMVFMKNIEITEQNLTDGKLIHIELSGNHFLHNMVRILCGTLAEIGEGKRQPEDMQKILAAKNRTTAGPTLPPHGLYLTKVDYDGERCY